MIRTIPHAIALLLLTCLKSSYSFLSLKTAFLRPSQLLLHISQKATQDQMIEYAQQHGISLSLSTFGPAFRSTARAANDTSLILGYCEGFFRPTGNIVQIEKLIVWKDALNKAKKIIDPSSFQSHAGNTFGVSLLVGYIALLHADCQSRPFETVEFLAIDDQPYQHKRLVRFFQRAGFHVVRYVGDDWKDIPDRLIWGGCGTLMDAHIDTLLIRWTDLLFSNTTPSVAKRLKSD